MTELHESYQKIGEAIKKLRIQAGLSQGELASGICDRTTVTHLENGRFKMPSIILINQLCRKLNVTLDEFLLFAYGGYVDHLLIKKNQINSLMRVNRFEEAYKIAKNYYSPFNHPNDKQYLLLIKANYYYSLKKYQEAKDTCLEALSFTTKIINQIVYLVDEIKLLQLKILCDIKLKTPNSNLSKDLSIVLNSINNFPVDKDYIGSLNIYLTMMEILLELNKYDMIDYFSLKFIHLSKSYSSYENLNKFWEIMCKFYEQQGLTQLSNYYQNKITEYNNLLNNNSFILNTINSTSD